MVDCCLFVCWRPRTYERLIADIYKAHNEEKNISDIDLNNNRGKIDRFIDYVTAYPEKLRFATTRLNKYFSKSFIRNQTGYVLLTIHIYQIILQKYSHLGLVYMLESHMNFILMECFGSKNPMYIKSCSSLLNDCIRCNVFSLHIDFFPFIILLCGEAVPDAQKDKSDASPLKRTQEDNAQSSKEAKIALSFAGFNMLLSMLPLLQANPHWMQLYLPNLATVLCKITFCYMDDINVENILSFDTLSSLLKSCKIHLAKLQDNTPKSLSEISWKTLYATCNT